MRSKPSNKPFEVPQRLLFPSIVQLDTMGSSFAFWKYPPLISINHFSSLLKKPFVSFMPRSLVKYSYLYCSFSKARENLARQQKTPVYERGCSFSWVVCFWSKKCFMKQNASDSKFIWVCSGMFIDCFLLSLTKAVYHASKFWFIFTALQMENISNKKLFVRSVLIQHNYLYCAKNALEVAGT